MKGVSSVGAEGFGLLQMSRLHSPIIGTRAALNTFPPLSQYLSQSWQTEQIAEERIHNGALECLSIMTYLKRCAYSYTLPRGLNKKLVRARR